jgi:hypothetical protein
MRRQQRPCRHVLHAPGLGEGRQAPKPLGSPLSPAFSRPLRTEMVAARFGGAAAPASRNAIRCTSASQKRPPRGAARSSCSDLHRRLPTIARNRKNFSEIPEFGVHEASMRSERTEANLTNQAVEVAAHTRRSASSAMSSRWRRPPRRSTTSRSSSSSRGSGARPAQRASKPASSSVSSVYSGGPTSTRPSV